MVNLLSGCSVQIQVKSDLKSGEKVRTDITHNTLCYTMMYTVHSTYNMYSIHTTHIRITKAKKKEIICDTTHIPFLLFLLFFLVFRTGALISRSKVSIHE